MAEINTGLDYAEHVGRLRVDHSQESARALKILREAGIRVSAVPISGTVGPELTLGSRVYYGLNEIERLARSQTKKS